MLALPIMLGLSVWSCYRELHPRRSVLPAAYTAWQQFNNNASAIIATRATDPSGAESKLQQLVKSARAAHVIPLPGSVLRMPTFAEYTLWQWYCEDAGGEPSTDAAAQFKQYLDQTFPNDALIRGAPTLARWQHSRH
jgi:hypothetical protein